MIMERGTGKLLTPIHGWPLDWYLCDHQTHFFFFLWPFVSILLSTVFFSEFHVFVSMVLVFLFFITFVTT